MSQDHEKTTTGSIIELVVIVAVALGLALGIQAFLVKPYRIPSESMVPTLEVGQRVLVNRIGARFTDPKVNDIVVFHPPVGADTETCGVPRVEGQPCSASVPRRQDVNFIKRVVAVGGDTISIRDGHVFRNGQRQTEDFIRECGDGPGCDLPKPITIPKDHFFMMGDNRGQSDDSRFWGPIPEDWIIGNAFATYWPPTRIGLL